MTIKRKLKSEFVGVIGQDLVDAPFTTIQNRAGVNQSFKPVFGNERVMVNSISKVITESGPNGEEIWETDKKDSRIRFIGAWLTVFDTHGMRITSSADEGKIEVTFYGTYLNLLSMFDGGGRDFRYTVNGGVESTNIVPASPSSILSGRNTKPNQVLNVVKDLTEGWHTVLLRHTTGNILVYGFEFGNESTDIKILEGNAFVNGYEYISDTILSTPYNTGFENILDANLGTKGGKVLVYIDSIDNTIKKKFVPVDPRSTGDPSAPELVTNGTFNSDISGWSDWGSGLIWDAGNGGQARHNYSADTGAYQLITTVIGVKYQFTFKIVSISTHVNNTLYVSVKEGSLVGSPSLVDIPYPIGTTGIKTIEFTATTTTTQIRWGVGGSVSGNAYADDFSVKEVGYNFLAMGDTDHSDEKLSRIINSKEFGRNRGDDFSTLSGTSLRAFTLDDGVNTLSGYNVSVSTNTLGVQPSPAGSFIAQTFLGSGLDIDVTSSNNATGTTNIRNFEIDGVLVAAVGVPVTPKVTRFKICSGLSLGEHIFKLSVPAIGGIADVAIVNFLVYEPKQPSIAEGSLKICEYSILANYITNSVFGNKTYGVSTGVIRKAPTRETIYTGAWTASLNPQDGLAGIVLYSNASGATCTQTFNGSGFELRWAADTNRSTSITVEIDGLTDHSLLNTGVYGQGSFNAATGILSQNGAGSEYMSGLYITGLSSGLHKVKFINNTTGYIQNHALDVVTPTYSNNLSSGSNSLKDLRNFESGKVKGERRDMVIASVLFDTVANITRKSKNISQVLEAGVGDMRLYFEDDHSGEVYMTGISGDAGTAYIKNSSTNLNIKVVTIQNHVGTLVNNSFNSVEYTGILEKDILEEE